MASSTTAYKPSTGPGLTANQQSGKQPTIGPVKKVVYTNPKYLPNPEDIYVRDNYGQYIPATQSDPRTTNTKLGYYVRTPGGGFVAAEYAPYRSEQEPQVVMPSSTFLPSYNPEPTPPFDPAAPSDYVGGVLGPNGEALPPGALFYTKDGKPYFGEQIEELSLMGLTRAFVGWTQKLNYNIFGPSQEQVPIMQGVQNTIESTNLKEGAQNVATMAGNLLIMAGNAVHNAENTGSGIDYVTRAFSEAVGSLFNLIFMQPQRIVGRIVASAKVAAQGEERDTAWAASLMDGTAVTNQGKLNDFIRRYEINGENPVLLARELEDPIADMVYDTITDPWTYLGIGELISQVKNGYRAVEIADITRTLSRIAPEMADAAKAYRAAEASGDAARVIAATDALLAQVDLVRGARVGVLDDLVRAVGAKVKVAGTKRIYVTDTMHNVLNAILVTDKEKDASQVANLARDLAILSRSDDPVLRAGALANVMRSGAREVLLSPAGVQTGEMLADLMFEGRRFVPRRVASLQSIAAEIAKLPAKQQPAAWAEAFAKLSDKVAEARFPTILERVENQQKIASLVAKGTRVEDLPANLARFVGDEVPEWAIRLSRFHQAAQRVVGPVNRVLGFVFIRANPAVWARNFLMDGLQSFIDNPRTWNFFKSTDANLARVSEWIGRPSRLQSAGFSQVLSAVPGQELNTASGGKVLKWLTTRMEAVERTTASRVAVAAVEEAMRSGIKGMLRDASPILRGAGMSPQEISQLEKLLYHYRGNWGEAVRAFGGSDASLRAMGSLSDEAHKFIVDYKLAEDLRNASIIQDATERSRAYDAIREAWKAGVEAGLNGYDKNILSEALGEQDALDALEHLARGDVDIFATKAVLSRRAVRESGYAARDAFASARMQAAGDPQALAQIDGIEQQWRLGHDAAARAYAGVRERLRAEAVARARAEPELADLIWDEYFLNAAEAEKYQFKYLTSPGNMPDGTPLPASRDAVQVLLRDAEVQVDIDGVTQLTEVAPGLDHTTFDRAMAQVDATRAWDGVKTAEEVAGLPHEVRLAGINAADDLQPTAGMAQANAGQPGGDMLERAISEIETSLANKKFTVRPEVQAALEQIAPDIEAKLASARAVASEYADIKRKFTLLDYSDKRGMDLALAYLFPYQYWYSRTYSNWITRLAKDPWVGAAYGRYRNTLASLHANMPPWWQQSLNSNELFGLNSENPLYFNLEQSFNPLNGLTGVDFNDPAKRHGWFASLLDTLGKQGPSIWAPISWAMAGVYSITGDQEAAEAWAGRMIPQAGAVKAATGLMGIRGGGEIVTPTGVEIDPLVIAQGGLGKYERRSIGRMLGRMVSNGEITRAQADDAAYAQRGPIWERAGQLVVEEKGPSQLIGQFAGWSFKYRKPEDAAVDQMYAELYGLQSRKSLLSPQEYSQAWQRLRERFPFIDTVLMSRKSGAERDEALSWSVINRIPPGQTRDYAERVKMDPRLLDMFYEDKGDMSKWADTDRERFLAGIKDLGATLDVPETATSHEWSLAKGQYSLMNEEAKALFGPDILGIVDGYYAKKDDREASDEYLRLNPVVGQYLDWKGQRIIDDPLLSKYYGGIDFIESFLKAQMYSAADKKFGEDIWDTQAIYYEIKDRGGNYSAYKNDHPELAEFWNFLDGEKVKIAQSLADFGNTLPEVPQAKTRSDAVLQSLGAQDVIAGISQTAPNDARHASEVLAYTSMPNETKWSLTGYIEDQAEGRWPGVVAKNDAYEETLATSPSAAAEFLRSNPDVLQYRRWEREYRANYNRMAKYGPEANRLEPEQLRLAPAAQRLMDDLQAGEELPESMKEYLDMLGIDTGVVFDPGGGGGRAAGTETWNIPEMNELLGAQVTSYLVSHYPNIGMEDLPDNIVDMINRRAHNPKEKIWLWNYVQSHKDVPPTPGADSGEPGWMPNTVIA